MRSLAHPGLLACFLFFFTCSCQAESEAPLPLEQDGEYRRGLALGREGRHDEALAVLLSLRAKYPASYPLERDIVVITAWKGDCRATVRRHERLRHHRDFEPFYILPVSDCLTRLGRLDEAVSLLEAGRERWPEDAALVSAHAAASGRRQARFLNELKLEVNSNDSDEGKREWLWGARLSRQLTDRTRVHARYAASRSGYDDLQTGKQDRLGFGVEHEFPLNFVLTQEFSQDIHRDGQNGSFTSVVYLPNDSWRFGASRTSFAEDLPLRAKAALIEARQNSFFARFQSPDYLWAWSASASRYDFTDNNQRSVWLTSLGYAYELDPKREQRVFLEIYGSKNTLGNTVAYFNPSRDKSVSVVHKTDFVRTSRFRRHVDHLYLSAGLYDQAGFATHSIWRIRYEQDYDFTERSALLAGIGYGRRVYDGASEFETSLSAAFRWLF